MSAFHLGPMDVSAFCSAAAVSDWYVIVCKHSTLALDRC